MPVDQTTAFILLDGARREGRTLTFFTQLDVDAAREAGRRQGLTEASAASANRRQPDKKVEQKTPSAADNFGWNDVIDKMNKAPPSSVIR